MASFGEKLRAEREARNTTIEDVSAATGIQPDYLAALEKNEFHSLPGRGFGKFYIRAYAKTLGIDPRQLLDDYDREQDARRRETSEPPAASEPARPRQAETVIQQWRMAAVAEREKALMRAAMLARERASEPAAPGAEDALSDGYETAVIEDSEPATIALTPPPPLASWASRPLVAALVFLVLFTTAAGAYFVFFRTTLEGSERAVAQPSAAAPTPSAPALPEPAPAPLPDRTPTAPAAPKPARVAARRTEAPGTLSVQQFGVGRHLANGVATDGESPFGLWEVVSFSTRVLGARAGDRIVHVWLHEGRVMQSIDLKLGGASWRTHSRKTLGKVGEWAVEARDSEGRVLARSTFTCVPTGS